MTMKKMLIVAAVIMVVVLMGMQSPQKVLAAGKVYEAANGEIFPVTEPLAISSLEGRARTTHATKAECQLIVIGPKSKVKDFMKAESTKSIKLYICGSSIEPYCITQQGKLVCYPKP
jgi:hypothetical protein